MLYWNPRTNLIVCFVSIVCAGRHLVLGTGSWDYWLDLTIGRLKQMLHPEEVGGGSVARTEHIMSHGRFLWTSIQNIEKWYTSKQYQQQVEVHFQVFIQSKVANIRKIYLMTRLMVSTVFM